MVFIVIYFLKFIFIIYLVMNDIREEDLIFIILVVCFYSFKVEKENLEDFFF